MTDYNALLRQLVRETINLSDDGKIMSIPAFKQLEADCAKAKPVLLQHYGRNPTRAVMLLLQRLRGK